MAEGINIKGIVSANGDVHKVDYQELNNKPTIPTVESVTAALKQNIAASEEVNAFQVNIPCDDSNTSGGGSYTLVSKSGKLLYATNGTPSAKLCRYCIYGTFAMSTTAPTYANRPTWYNDPLTSFTVGHKYKFDYKVISGTIDRTGEDGDFYFDLRTQSGPKKQIGNLPDVWECTFQPEMIAFVFREFDFDDAVIYLSVIDLTEQEANAPLVERVEALEEKGVEYPVPEYYREHLATAIAKINSDINSNKATLEHNYGTDIESFVFITDVHWAANKKHSPALIKAVLDATPIRTVICGGDFIQESNETKAGAVAEIKDFTNQITQIPCYEYYCVYGNHDNNSINGAALALQFTKEEQFNLLYAPFADKPNVHWIWEEAPTIFATQPVKNDYYVDHPRTKTRFLCIDWNNPLSDARKAWMSDVLDKDDGYRVIVIYHGIYSGSGGTISDEHTDIMDIIEDYRGKVVAVFCGHAHQDYIKDYYEDGSVPVILTANDTFRPATMTEGTITEQCFDVVVVDYGQNIIKLTRIGRGSNRTAGFTLT